MKTIINFIIICLFFFFPLLDKAVGGIYAQEQELFNHTWYFEYGEIDGANLYPPSSFTGELIFYSSTISLYHPYCQDGQDAGIQYDSDNPFFSLHLDGVILIGVCGQPNEIDFMSKHYSIYRKGNDYKNPFILHPTSN